MYATILVSPYVQIQGLISRRLPCGSVVISVQQRDYVGTPLNHAGSPLRAVC